MERTRRRFTGVYGGWEGRKGVLMESNEGWKEEKEVYWSIRRVGRRKRRFTGVQGGWEGGEGGLLGVC